MPSSVTVPQDYLLNIHIDQRNLVESVAESIAASIGIPKVDQSLAYMWDADKPDPNVHMPLSTYLEEVPRMQ
jgi:hypothetical protein